VNLGKSVKATDSVDVSAPTDYPREGTGLLISGALERDAITS